MPTCSFPVLVWKNSAGIYTASLVEYAAPAAVAASAKSALEQLKSFVEWQYRQEPAPPLPELRDAKLVQYRVSVRPEYQDAVSGRRYPVSLPVELRVHCVLGKQSEDNRFASIPIPGLRLQLTRYDEPDVFVPRMVQRWFEDRAPGELAAFAPPDEVLLELIHVTIQPPVRSQRLQLRTPQLEKIADPLGETHVRSLYGRAWERDDEVREFATRLQREQGSWLLVGEAGSGRTTLLCEAVRQIERDLHGEQRVTADTPSVLRPARRFWQTSAGRLIAGMMYLGEWQERLEGVIGELADIDGVLCIESLPELLRTGGRESTDSLAAFCTPYLQRGELRMIAEVTPAQLDACRRLLPGFVDLFHVQTLKTLTSQQAVRVLERVAENAAAISGIRVAPQAAARVVRLFERFQSWQVFPGAVATFWKDLLDRSERKPDRSLCEDDVLTEFLKRTGLPEKFLRDEVRVLRATVLQQFESEIIGQPGACAAAADMVIQFKAGLNDPQRPLGVLLFCGPTGVGKTELAKAISRCLFGGNGPERPGDATMERTEVPRMLRLDMSEYSGPWAADRLLLKSDGDSSDFIQQIRRQPFTVLLMDEIEKAHPAVFDVLMNVFDEGRLTDRFGRVTWFRSTVIILTSNLGSVSNGSVGFGGSSQQSAARHEAAVREFFRPEFFNRLDRVVTFDPLSERAIEGITENEMRRIAGREGLSRRGVQLTWTADVVSHLARTAFDPRYGARPLQRALESLIVAPLAARIVNRSTALPTVIHCRLREGQIVLDEMPPGGTA
ncbi:MAG: ATP-dependent Clp protease ATP-binding subunit ClpC [Planctomycetota bacterium]|jgi:ATP-dependent Clp protease ATP-binding subunit ClpC